MADMNDKMNARSLGRKNKKGLALSKPPPKAPEPSTQDAQIPGAIGNNSTGDPGTLEIGVEFKLDLRSEDLVVLKELGAGNGGTVSKVMHSATKVIMAKKVRYSVYASRTEKWPRADPDLGHTCRCKEGDPKIDRQGIAYYARLHFTKHRQLLGCLSS